MAADLFETYAVTIVATMVLSSIFPLDYNLMIYPSYSGACILTSIIGTWFVRLGKSKYNKLYKGFIVTAILSLLILYPVLTIVGLDNSYSKVEKILMEWTCIYAG